MNRTRRTVLQTLAGVLPASALLPGQGVIKERPARKPNVVLVSGEPEYRSESTLADLAQELESKHGMRCTLLVMNGPADIPGLDALESADLAIWYLRFLDLPPDQLGQIRSYVGNKKPLIALRTTTHAFNNWKEFGQEVLGAPWRYHYGHDSSTDVSVIPAASSHPILKGVDPQFHCRSWLYHVVPLPSDLKLLMTGKSVGPSDRTERAENPVAWTREYKGKPVFYTSLGHPEDFKLAPFRTMLANAVHWARPR
jgi:type 1 glutamine amidotransferase